MEEPEAVAEAPHEEEVDSVEDAELLEVEDSAEGEVVASVLVLTEEHQAEVVEEEGSGGGDESKDEFNVYTMGVSALRKQKRERRDFAAGTIACIDLRNMGGQYAVNIEIDIRIHCDLIMRTFYVTCRVAHMLLRIAHNLGAHVWFMRVISDRPPVANKGRFSFNPIIS